MKVVNVRWYNEDHHIIHVTYNVKQIGREVFETALNEVSRLTETVSRPVHIITNFSAVTSVAPNAFELISIVNRDRPTNFGMLVHYGVNPAVRAFSNAVLRFLRESFDLYFVDTLQDALAHIEANAEPCPPKG